MEIKKAIEILDNERTHCGKKVTYTEREIYEAFSMAIRALEKQLPNGTLDSLILEFGISDYLTESVRDWLEYKSERNFKYKERGLRTLLRTISEKSFQYGDTAVANAINESISSGYQGIVWDKLKKAGGDGMNWDSL